MMRIFFVLSLLFFATVSSNRVYANIDTKKYGLTVHEADLSKKNHNQFDSLLSRVPQMSASKVINFIAKPHFTENNTLDFYMLLILCGLLGVVKTIHPKYFNDLWRAFVNPTLGARQLKDIIQSAIFPNVLMNLYSSVVLGIYVYYLISINIDWRFAGVPNVLLIGLLVIGTVLMYLGKYIFIQLTGWALGMHHISEQYNFNIFLVNKILAMALLPFIICFAFLNDQWNPPILIISILVIALLLLNRYTRSWNIFAQFFQNSRFHFFMYLCAFEILPLAVLLKSVLLIL